MALEAQTSFGRGPLRNAVKGRGIDSRDGGRRRPEPLAKFELDLLWGGSQGVGLAGKSSVVGPSGLWVARDGGSGLEPAQHAACVDAWLERHGKGLSPEALLRLFEAALGALWARTATTLGDVTLTAIGDRVLYNASEAFPLFSSLKVEPAGGIAFSELKERISSAQDGELVAGIRFVLVEFLSCSAA